VSAVAVGQPENFAGKPGMSNSPIAAYAQMRVRHGLVQGEDRRAGNALSLERSHCLFSADETREPGLDDSGERLIVVAPGARVAETGVFRQLGHVHGIDELRHW
jgi:hypothetical protein